MLTDRKGLGFKDVLIVPEPSNIRSRKDVSLEREFSFQNRLKKTFVPIIAANMEGIGTFKTAKVLSKYKMITCIHKETPLAAYEANFLLYPEIFPYIACTVGLNDRETLYSLQRDRIPVDIFCADVANGYMTQFIDYVSWIREEFPEKIIIAGNVATEEGAQALYEAGADIIKIGIGSGSVCTTRYKTGVGVPQISAIDNCFDTPYICSDGGCTGPGDTAKAFVAGADFVMLGGMFAGTIETGSVFSGSAHYCDRDYKTSEGKTIQLPAMQSLDDQVIEILGGLRSTGSYIGQDKIENFYKASLIQVNEQTNNWFGPPE